MEQVMEQEIKRGPGRPPKAVANQPQTEEKKKGKRSWVRGADRLTVNHKDPNYSYRWADKNNEAKIEQRKDLGYRFVNPTTGASGEAGELDVTGAKRMGDLVLMALPMALKKERDQEIEELTDRQTLGLKKTLQDEMSQGGKAVAEGKIIIE